MSAGQKIRKLVSQYLNQQMHVIKYDKTQFMRSVEVLHVSTSGCHPQGSLLEQRNASLTLVGLVFVCGTALQELKDYQIKRSIVCQEVWRAQKVASSSKPLYEISCVLGWWVGLRTLYSSRVEGIRLARRSVDGRQPYPTRIEPSGTDWIGGCIRCRFGLDGDGRANISCPAGKQPLRFLGYQSFVQHAWLCCLNNPGCSDLLHGRRNQCHNTKRT